MKNEKNKKKLIYGLLFIFNSAVFYFFLFYTFNRVFDIIHILMSIILGAAVVFAMSMSMVQKKEK